MIDPMFQHGPPLRHDFPAAGPARERERRANRKTGAGETGMFDGVWYYRGLKGD
ncbi:MAG: hypothetical protein AAF559_05360 [Pseudomonadota bacterium]